MSAGRVCLFAIFWLIFGAGVLGESGVIPVLKGACI